MDIDGNQRNTMTNWCFDKDKFPIEKLKEEMNSKGKLLNVNVAYVLAAANAGYYKGEEFKEIFDDTFWETADVDEVYEIGDLYKDSVINNLDVLLLKNNLVKNNNVKETSCSSDNAVVDSVIKRAPNSYGLTLAKNNKAEPKYKITLTPSLMNEISNFEYESGKKLKYTDLILNCKDYIGNDCADKTVYRKYTSKLLDELVSKEEQQEGSGLKITNSSKR